MVPETSTVSNVFGSRVYERYRSDLTLMEATTRNDEEENPFGGLVKEGTAALLNSYAREGFPYRPWQVKTLVIQALVSGRDTKSTKFDSNLKHLSEQAPVTSRKYFYRVENMVTPVADNPVLCVKPVTELIHGFARLFITQCFAKGYADRLQVFSTDFIDEDFVDSCVGLTHARIEGKA